MSAPGRARPHPPHLGGTTAGASRGVSRGGEAGLRPGGASRDRPGGPLWGGNPDSGGAEDPHGGTLRALGDLLGVWEGPYMPPDLTVADCSVPRCNADAGKTVAGHQVVREGEVLAFSSEGPGGGVSVAGRGFQVA